MLAPTFVITKLENGILYYLSANLEPEDELHWSQNTAFIFTNLKYVVAVANNIPGAIDVKSINFVGKV